MIINGDSAKELKKFKDNSIDAVITDPPYGIEFLAKDWDSNTGAVEIWEECLRVLKPGGFLLAFSAARTYHILATNIQSAGFEIRDQIMWLQSNGFPKSKTMLKPQHEPICMAKKKGKAYLNITDTKINNRLPSNVIGEVNGYQKYFYCPRVSRKERHKGLTIPPALFGKYKGAFDSNGKRYAVQLNNRAYANSNTHPTVKPVDLMKYLIKLVAPQGSHILDPFAGSGTTGMACKELGYTFTGIEMDKNYCEIAKRRISAS
jgi:DNA modification methylase